MFTGIFGKVWFTTSNSRTGYFIFMYSHFVVFGLEGRLEDWADTFTGENVFLNVKMFIDQEIWDTDKRYKP